MSAVEPPIDDVLADWVDIDPALTSNGLLLGNGASRAIWDKFKYDSLFDNAKLLSALDRLQSTDEAIFTALNTKNFETVLSALMDTELVMQAIGKPDPDIMTRYLRIRSSLVKAVHNVHIDHAKIPQSTFNIIGKELNRYIFVYSTNYDLIIYWSMLIFGTTHFKDYFFGSGPCFDPSDTKVWGKVTRVLFVHGGLHLYIDPTGSSCKSVAGSSSLLTNFGTSKDIPLFISEGEAKDKLKAIYGSDYLSFAYSCLANHRGPLVIFGQGLGPPDNHLVDAINRAIVKNIVIGIYPSTSSGIKAEKVHYKKCFPDSTLHFFDSTSHPIGNISLQIPP